MAYTTIDDPSAHFQTVTYTGNDTARAITNTGNSDLAPDLVWIKSRNAAGNHNIYDSSRGVNKRLMPDENTNEITSFSNLLTAFSSDGFSLGNDSNNYSVNENSTTFVAKQWKANGGTRTTHTESGANPGGGFQANTTAGFSIVDYVGTGGAGHVTHGLGAVPEFIIMKNRDESESWLVYHVSLGNGKGLRLDTKAAADTTANHWANTTPNSSTIVVGGNPPNNKDAVNYIAYCFTPIQGYSKFGTYIGNQANDNAGEGQFVYTGFKPALVFRKRTDAIQSWNIWNNTTNGGYNPVNHSHAINTTDPEDSNATYNTLEFCANGFRLQHGNDSHNLSGHQYAYGAWAECPFVTSTGVPCTAR